MRLLLVVLLLAGCASGDDGADARMRVNGVYTTFSGGVMRH